MPRIGIARCMPIGLILAERTRKLAPSLAFALMGH